jgi:predicted ATPase
MKENFIMRVLSLDVDGFRSLRHIANWQPGALNVLIGPNGTGKSNVLRVLELAAESAQGHLGRYIQTNGGMEPLVWDGSAEAIRFRAKCSPADQTRDKTRDSLTYELKLERIGKTGEYRIDYELLANYLKVEQGIEREPMKFLERQGLRARVFDMQNRMLTAPEENVPPGETLLSLAADPFTQNRLIPPFRAQLAAWSIYHDFHTDRDAAIRQPAVTKFDKRVSHDGQNLIPVLHTLYTNDREFKNEINVAMRAAFGGDFDELIFAPAADQRIQLRVRWRSLQREQSAADLSDGTLRFLFLLAVLASPEAAPLIAIDEPETGLHPSMLPIVAEYAVEAARRSQVIFSTHSPQFLDAFGRAKLTTTVVRWEDGETELKTFSELELREWLKEYSMGNLYLSGELEALA